jgi:hypothetical protein
MLPIFSTLSQAMYPAKVGKRIIFDGNSLTNQSQNGIVGGQRYPLTCFESIRILRTLNAYFNFAIGSRRTQTLTAEFDTKILPSASPGDIIVFWEITNNAHDLVDDTAGTALFANVVAYCDQVRNHGLICVCLTGIARDMPSFDDPDITSRIIACNDLMRANPSSFCDLLVDVGALTQFDAKTDTTNTTYYHSDRTHLTNTGYDLIASTVYTAMNGAGMFA